MQEFFEAVLWAKIWPIAAVAFALLGIADGARRIVVGVILMTEDMHQNDGEDRGQREPDGPVEAGRDDQRGLRRPDGAAGGIAGLHLYMDAPQEPLRCLSSANKKAAPT